MSLLALAELFAVYAFVAFVVSAAALTAFINLYGGDSLRLLDGTRLQSALDDRDRRAHVHDAALVEDQQVAALDALWDLPTRTHP